MNCLNKPSSTDGRIAGSFRDRGGYGFDIALVSYFDGKEWHSSEFRGHTSKHIYNDEDVKKLKKLGIKAVFGPGSSIASIADFLKKNVRSK